jgi:hypothetical protein
MAALVMIPAGVQWNAHGNAGQMQHMIPPEGCNDRSSGVPFVGASGELIFRSAGAGTDWDHRVQLRAGASFVAGDIAAEAPATGRRPVQLGYGRMTVGWDSRYLGLRFGLYGGNVEEGERELIMPAMSARVGTRSAFVRASIFDQPHCYPANCVFGLEAGTDILSVGGSIGITQGRFFARGRIPNVIGGLDLRGGVFLGARDDDAPDSVVRGKDFVFSLGVGGHWDVAPPSPRSAADHAGPPGAAASH